ncbi:MAG: MFS transporter [Anaerolineae bacterium]|nr:MFS transporter [Anaerolineae bacterium]
MPSFDDTARRSLIIRYVVAVFLYWMALYLYVPTLPTYAESKSDTLSLVGVVLAQYGLWQAIARLPVGTAADWLGRRKPFIVVGFGLAGLAATTWVPLVVVFSGLFPPRESVRASALLTFVGSAGRMIATGVTGWLNGVGGYPLAFFIATGVAGLAVLAVLPARETPRTPQMPSLGGVLEVIRRRDVILPSLLAAVAQYANWATSFGFLPILARQLGASDVTLSFLMSLNIGVITAGNLLTTTIANRFGARQLLYLSFLLQTAGIGGAALAPTLPWLFAAQIGIGLSQSFGYPVMMGMSIEHVPDDRRTTAMGLFQAVYGVGMFAGPGLSGVLADAMGIRPMFGATALACLVMGLAVTYWLTANRQQPTSTY